MTLFSRKVNIKMANNNQKQTSYSGPILGFVITTLIGFALYGFLSVIQQTSNAISVVTIAENAHSNILYKLLWFLMNFTDPEFYASFLASAFIIFGGVLAWRLDKKRSKYRGFNVCYGTNMFPWVFGAQVLSAGIAIFVMGYTRDLSATNTWVPTFITIVGAPVAIMYIFGPSVQALLTGSILGGVISVPIATWISSTIIPVIEVPGVVANVMTMALTGALLIQVCYVLPWMKKVPMSPIDYQEPALSQEEELANVKTTKWFVRRAFADFSEAQFYGNEIAGLFVIVGACLDFILFPQIASNMLGSILLGQFVAGGVGILLYHEQYAKQGWYATYVPVVSVAPACILAFGGGIPVALVAGVLGGIISAPTAEFFAKKLPDGFHGTIANVTSMAISTIIVYTVMNILPCF